MQNTPAKACVIGLDGATFAVLDRWIASGDMPNLAELIARGCRSDLESTIPAVTGPAWTSMTTGVGPGEHGILDFYKWGPDGLTGRLAQSGDVKVPRLWDLAGAQGKTVGVFNVPVTFPAWEVNGFMVTGMLTPRAMRAMTYPDSLHDDLRDRGLLPYTRARAQQQSRQAARRITEAHEGNRRTVAFLLEKYRPDFFMGVFTEPDRLQHRFWAYCDSDGGGEDRVLAERVREFYRAVDETIGTLRSFFGDDTTYFVVSDHGFGQLLMECRLNKHLAARGLLKVRRRQFGMYSIRHRAEAAAQAICRKLGLLGLARTVRRKLAPSNKRGLGMHIDQFTELTKVVDWSRTRAFVKSRSDCGIHINTRGKYPQGIVEDGAEREKVIEEIIGVLRELEDPISGGKLEVHYGRREQVLTGRYVSDAPDLYVSFRKGTISYDGTLGGPLFSPSEKTGTHRMEGVLVACGPGIKAGGEVKAHILDVTPTVLHSMGIPVPRYVEGRVLTDLFEDEWAARRPVVWQEEPPDSDGAGPGAYQYTPAEEQTVAEHLRHLGYL